MNCGYGRSNWPRDDRRGVDPLARHQSRERVRERHVEIARVAAKARDRLVVLGLRDDIDVARHAELADLVADVGDVEADIPRQLDVDAGHPLIGVRESRSRDWESVGPVPIAVSSPSSPASGCRKPAGNGFAHGVPGSMPFGAVRDERRRPLEVGRVDAVLAAARQPEIGPAVIGAGDQPVVDLVGQADARLDVVPVALVRRLRAAAVREEQPAR